MIGMNMEPPVDDKNEILALFNNMGILNSAGEGACVCMRVCVCVSVYVCVCLCVWVCMCVYVSVYKCISVCILSA
jgi:hypothetical protein